jgi:probable phosphoglycerate mutase
MKTIYFVRHGSTAGNEAISYQTHETDLSEKGKAQAEVLAKRFDSIQADLIISSEMKRAHMTAEAIATRKKIPLETHPLLHEILRPTIVRDKPQSDPEVRKIMQEIKSHFGEKDWHHSDEENFYDLQARAEKVLSDLMNRKEENIIVVSHGHTLRAIVGVITLGEELTPKILNKFFHNLHTENTGITMCKEYEGRLSLHTWNDYVHLGEISE